jgi:hypothetical protein
MKRFAVAPLAALGIPAGAVPAAHAADTTCTTTISSGTTINGNLTVPAGATCRLANVTVTGNVQVGKGASLTVAPATGQTVTIGGNVQADKCQLVELVSTPPFGFGPISVGGNVQIRNCTGASGYNGTTVTISGNFACDHNSGGCLAAFGSVRGNLQFNNDSNGGGPGAAVSFNVVGGNVQVDNNSGNSASIVEDNRIGGNLQCAGNTPNPPGVTDEGAPNLVAGHKQGQCAGL